MLVIISQSWSSSQKRQKQTWAELHSNHIFDIILTISTSSTSHHIYFLVRPSFLTFSFFVRTFKGLHSFCLVVESPLLSYALIRATLTFILCVLCIITLRKFNLQFAFLIWGRWCCRCRRCCCTLHCRHPARWRRPRHQHRHCRHYYYCWWCSVDAGCTLIWFLFPKTSGVLHVTGVSASFIALQNCNLENGGRVAWHQ